MLTAAIAATLGGAAQAAPRAAAQPVVVPQTTTTTVFGDDACPTAANGDIIVCGRLPENERYRIPKKLRQNKAARVAQSWSNQNRGLDELARMERPNSCSVNGTGGQTGCSEAMIRQWADERRANGQRVGIPF